MQLLVKIHTVFTAALSSTRDATAESVSRDQILRHERGQENIHFLFSADDEQDWQSDPIDPYYISICVTVHT